MRVFLSMVVVITPTEPGRPSPVQDATPDLSADNLGKYYS
jgi:hypothetical protein